MNNSNLIEFTKIITEKGSLFISEGIKLKDGRESPYFLNMGIFNTGQLLSKLGKFYADYIVKNNLYQENDCIIGPSYKGISIALSCSLSLWESHKIDCDFDFDRQNPKTHGEGSNKQNHFVTSAIDKAKRILILDDVASSMKTKKDIIEKINKNFDAKNTPEITGIIIAVDRQLPLPNEKADSGITSISIFQKETGIPVYSLFSIKDIFDIIDSNNLPIWQYDSNNDKKNGKFEALSDYWKEKIRDFHKLYRIR